MKNVDVILKACRKFARLTQSELSAKSGIAASSIANYEVGRTTPSVYNFEALLNACGFELMIQEKGKNERTNQKKRYDKRY